MPPRSTVEMRSCGSAVTWAGGPLLPLVPRAEGDPLGAEGGELFGPYRVHLAVLPLQHVVLHALVGILAVLRELDAPAVEHRAHGHVEGEHGRAELVEIVRLGLVEDDLEQPEPGPSQPVARQRLVARLLLDCLAEVHLDLTRLGPEGLEAETRPRLSQNEGAIAVGAQCLAEVDRAVARRSRVDQRLEYEILLPRLSPEEHGVGASRDVMDDIRVELLELGDDG